MEQQVLELVTGSQSSDQATRQAAELQLTGLYSNENLPAALVTIGAHNEVTTADRIAALIMLKLFIGKHWSPVLEEYAGKLLVSYDVKAELRGRLLAIIFDGSADSKVIGQTAAVITKIAKADFPEAWPTLLDSLLGHQQTNDAQAEGVLVVLKELIDGGLDEEQFYQCAQALVKYLHDVVMHPDWKCFTKAHAVYVFRLCFDFVETLKDKEEYDIKSFTVALCDMWKEVFLAVVSADLPDMPTVKQENETGNEVVSVWRGFIALKIQIFLTLEKIQIIYPDILPVSALFNHCWDELKVHGSPYYASYVDGNRQGNLVSANGLPYTLDSLVIEELDFMLVLLDAPAVKQHLDAVIESTPAGEPNSVTQWIMQVMGTMVTFASITAESEGLWDIDYNVFLSEEAFAEVNANPRTASAAFVCRLCAWLPRVTLDSTFKYMKLIWDDMNPSWRHKEAVLYLLQQIVEEYKGEDRAVESEVLDPCFLYVPTALSANPHFLRARGHIVMAAIATTWSPTQVDLLHYAHASLSALEDDESDIVKTSCIRIMSSYLLSVPERTAIEMQKPIVQAIAAFLKVQDFEEMDESLDLVDGVLQTLRDLIMACPYMCLDHDGLELMLAMVKFGAARDETTFILIEEGFQSAAHAMAEKGPDFYGQFCAKVLPTLVEALDTQADDERKTAMTEVALNLLKLIADAALHPLPDGFMETTMPRICRVIFSDVDFYLHQQATLCLKELLSNDCARVFAWVDPEYQKGGLEMILLIIGHLLGPQVDDASAAEVGDLAVEVVEKAGPEALGPIMRELLQVVAVRLSIANHLGLIQSLAMVFARLALLNAQDVINFLCEIKIDQAPALDIVVKKWLENSTHFVGFEAIRQNIRALVTIYELHDARFTNVRVNGDEIFRAQSSRIRTRSMAKAEPIEFQAITAELKLVKLLVNELFSTQNAFGQPFGANRAPTTAKKAGSDDSWETSASGTPNLSPTKGDDETQKYLVDFFTRLGAEPHFQELYGQLSQAEQERLMMVVGEYQALEAQKAQLGEQ